MRAISVLVVDDDPSILGNISEYIKSNTEYKLDTVANATGAIDKLKHFPFDVIVSDFSMPEINGLELLKQVRTFSHIPFILMAGDEDAQIAIDAINLGVDYYLKKGDHVNLQFNELIQMIESGVQKKRDFDKIQEDLLNYEKRFESYSTPIIFSSSDGSIKSINPAGISLFATPNSELLSEIPLLEEVMGKDAISRMKTGDTFTLSAQINFSQLNKKYPGIINRTDTIYVDISLVPTKTQYEPISEYIIQIIDTTDEYLTKVELKKTGEQLGMALEGSRLGLWDWNIQTGEIKNSDRWAEITGYSPEEISHSTIQEKNNITHPKDVEISHQLLQKHFDGDIPYYELETRIQHKNGHWIWVFEKGKVVEHDKQGKPLRMIGTYADITERKIAEEEVKKNKVKLQAILDSTAEAIYGLDNDGNCTFCNASCLKMLGYSHQDELIGKNMHYLIHYKRQDGTPISVYDCRIFRAFKMKEGTHVDDEVLWRSDGTFFDAEYWSYPLFLDNELLGAVVTFIDITERKETTRALAERNQQIENFFSLSLELLCIANSEGYFFRLNPAWEKTLGWSNDELMRRRFLDFVHPDDIDVTLKAVSKLSQQNKVSNFITRYKCKDESYRWLEWRAALVNDITYGAAQDITERKYSEDRLRRQKNILYEISYAASHLMSSLSDNSIHEVLSRVGKTVGVSRTILFTHSYDQNGKSRIIIRSEWSEEGYVPHITNQNLQNIDWKEGGFSRWDQVLMNHGIIYGAVIDFPEREKDFFLNLSIKSLAAVPIFSLDDFLGFIGFYDQHDHVWFDYEIETLEITAGLIGATLGRQKAEGEVKTREANFSTFFNTIHDFLFVLDPNGIILNVNNSVIHRLGYSEDELIGHSVLKIHPEKRRQEAVSIVNEMLAGRCKVCHVPLISKDGIQIPVETSIVTGLWNGHPAIFRVSKDISAITISEEKFSKAFQTSGSLMGITKFETGEFIDVNQAFIDTLRFSREEVIGKRSIELGIFVDPNTRTKMVEDIKKTGHCRINQFKFKTKDGEILTGIFSSNLIKLQNENVLLSVLDDITEVIQLSDALLQANNKLQLLSSITRHDILNQVQSLFFVRELLKEKIKPENEMFIQIELLDKAVDTIYHQILFTKDYQDLGIHAAEWIQIEQIINIVKQDKIFSNLIIEVNTGTLEIFVDPMFSKVCYNLFENALRHGDHVSKITVNFIKEENNGVLIFEDNGMGVPKEEKERIFLQGVGKNTGFGLFLAKEIISITGISIRENGEEGKGARFELIIPVQGFRMHQKG